MCTRKIPTLLLQTGLKFQNQNGLIFSDEPEDLVYTDADFDTSDDEYDMSDDERDDDVTVCKADLAYLKGLQRAEHETRRTKSSPAL